MSAGYTKRMPTRSNVHSTAQMNNGASPDRSQRHMSEYEDNYQYSCADTSNTHIIQCEMYSMET